MPRGLGKYEAVVVALCLERRRRTLVGHYPIVVPAFRSAGTIVVLGYLKENAERLLVSVLDQLHFGVVLPRAERIHLRLRLRIVLLLHQRARVRDDAME